MVSCRWSLKDVWKAPLERGPPTGSWKVAPHRELGTKICGSRGKKGGKTLWISIMFRNHQFSTCWGMLNAGYVFIHFLVISSLITTCMKQCWLGTKLKPRENPASEVSQGFGEGLKFIYAGLLDFFFGRACFKLLMLKHGHVNPRWIDDQFMNKETNASQ